MNKIWLFCGVVLLCIVVLLAGCGRKKPTITNPKAIVVTPEHTAFLPGEPIFGEGVYQPSVEVIEQIYAYAYHLSVSDLIDGLSEYDAGLIVTENGDGIHFVNPITEDEISEKGRNLYARLACKNKAGLIDLTALESGEIGIDVYGDVNLTETKNGLNVKLFRDDKEVGSLARVRGDLDPKPNLSDLIFHTTTTQSIDQVYIELTIPWQSSFTLKSVYLYFMETELKGFADMAERITGGTGATPEDTYNVTNAGGFYEALEKVKAANNTPSIIYVDGTITYEDYRIVSGSDRRDINVDVENLSIIGVGTNGEFDGIGFKISGENIIIQNLTIHHVGKSDDEEDESSATDGIQINNAKYVMVDHCTLYNESMVSNPDKDKYDELISLKNQTECVILSWNELYDSYKTILVGSNDDVDALPDRKMIMHHNYIHGCNSRLPLYRGGHAHIYNNYYLNNNDVIECRTGSKLLIEHNYFNNCKKCIGFWNDKEGNPSGQWEVNDNIFINCDHDTPTDSTCDINLGSDYNYDFDPVEVVPTKVPAGAGVGKLEN